MYDTIAFTLGYVILLTSLSAVFLLPSEYQAKNRAQAPRFQVLVLGDVGRSPRMQYHAISLAKNGGIVDLIGYIGVDSDLHPEIVASTSIHVHALSGVPRFLATNNPTLFVLYGPIKAVYQALILFGMLAYRTNAAKYLLVQNPPSIPTLLIAAIVSYLRGTKLVVDWHNFGYSVLALRLGKSHPLVVCSQWYERTCARYATLNFTVTDAMAGLLKRDFGLKGAILPLHDRPASDFRPQTQEQRLAFLGQLPETAEYIDQIARGKARVLVSSTSWTSDEDFSVLLEALAEYSSLAISTHPHLPELIVVITGKGPLKDFYLNAIAELEKQDKLEMVAIKTAWLSISDYAKLLGSADLGVSLHQSSSGVDLPMKVVDMFGVGLPVVGWSKFPAWSELVTEGRDGRGFQSAKELSNVLIGLLGSDDSGLQILREGAAQQSKLRWDEHWDKIAGKALGLS